MSITVADPLELVLAREERVLSIKNALRAMSSRQQRVLLLHRIASQPPAAIAARLRISVREATDLSNRPVATIAAWLRISNAETLEALESALARLHGIYPA